MSNISNFCEKKYSHQNKNSDKNRIPIKFDWSC